MIANLQRFPTALIRGQMEFCRKTDGTPSGDAAAHGELQKKKPARRLNAAQAGFDNILIAETA